MLPALLAQAEELDVDGSALVAAHDVGAAVFRGVAQALPAAEHYRRRGWHTTSTVGRLAAVAALAALRGLDESTTRVERARRCDVPRRGKPRELRSR